MHRRCATCWSLAQFREPKVCIEQAIHDECLQVERNSFQCFCTYTVARLEIDKQDAA
jgi:hypothetical protein